MASENDSGLAPKQDSEISRKDVEAAKRKVEIETIKRRAKITAWNDYIEFVTAKLIGLGGVVVGGLEYLSPNTLPIELNRPVLVMGVGLALLVGKGILSLAGRVNKLVGDKP